MEGFSPRRRQLALLPFWAGSFVAALVPADVKGVAPVVSNVVARQEKFRSDEPIVGITYDLADSDSPTVRVSLQISADNGSTWTVPAVTVRGTGIGDAVKPGTRQYFQWYAGMDWPGQIAQLLFRVVANDDQAPLDMVLIPAGDFPMGNQTNAAEGSAIELPLHSVFVNGFYMDRYEVTKALWDTVRNWGLTHGYTDLPAQAGKTPAHPVQTISWFAMVKWCNARTENENPGNLVPVYYTNDAQTTIYKTGNVDITNAQVKWNASGYRLPTEAEWEKAARGGSPGHRFPWANIETITHSRANYFSSAMYPYDTSPTRGFNPTYITPPVGSVGGAPYTNPVGAFVQNGYGLYDMAGNVWERCWDRYGANYYGVSPPTDPHGPVIGTDRVIRGGCWFEMSFSGRCAARYNILPAVANDCVGFRTVRR